VDVDEGLGIGLLAVLGFEPEEVGEGESSEAEGADLEEVAAREAVAADEPVAGDGQHGPPPSILRPVYDSFLPLYRPAL
jgi:hypothetical protein